VAGEISVLTSYFRYFRGPECLASPVRLTSSAPHSVNAGLWRSRRGFYSRMRPFTIALQRSAEERLWRLRE